MIDPFIMLAPVLLLAIVGLVRFVGCISEDPGAMPETQQPDFTLPQGVYVGEQTVGLFCPQDTPQQKATIRYTHTDTQTPVTPASPLYTAQIKVTKTSWIGAIATMAGHAPSKPVTRNYVIQSPPTYVDPPAEYTEPDLNRVTSVVATPAFAAPVFVGSLIVVWIWYEPNQSQKISQVTDTAGNVYKLALGPTPSAFSARPEIWYAIAKSAANFQITAHFTGAAFAGHKAISAHQFTGPTNWTLGQKKEGSGNAPDPSCGAFNLSKYEVVVATAVVFPHVAQAHNPFVQKSGQNDNVLMYYVAQGVEPNVEARVNTGMQAVDFVSQMVSFKV